jgi:hypothetical protein
MRPPCCLCVSHNPVASKWLGKHVPAATNTRATIEELLDAIFQRGPRLIKYSVCTEVEAGD